MPFSHPALSFCKACKADRSRGLQCLQLRWPSWSQQFTRSDKPFWAPAPSMFFYFLKCRTIGLNCSCVEAVAEIAETAVNDGKSLICRSQRKARLCANGSQDVSILDICHFHFHPFQNSSAQYFNIPEETGCFSLVFSILWIMEQ